MSQRALVSMVASLGVALLWGAGAARTSAATVNVAAANFQFTPSSKTVHVGDTVTWTMSGDGHTVRSGTIVNNVGVPSSGPLKSGLRLAGQSYSFTFTVAGTYRYFCEVHADSGMQGTITVVALGTPKPTPKSTPAATPRLTPAPTSRPSPVPTPSSGPTAAVTASPTSSATPPVAVVTPGSSDGSAPPPTMTLASPGSGSTVASDALPLIPAGILIAVAILGTLLVARARRNG